MSKVRRHGLDIELTNRCNAYCNFCPRDKTPQQGFMAFETFKKAALRAKEEGLQVMLAGQGESTIHPEFEACITFLSEQNIEFGLTTNASLLTKERSQFLLEKGMQRMTFSAGDLEDDYEEVYGLEFENTLKNIRYFVDLSNGSFSGQCEAWISLVEHEINFGKREQIKRFWDKLGLTGVYSYRQISRGGACESGHYFLSSDSYINESLDVMEEESISPLCDLAFTAPFIGWSGQYYVCCSDYEKKVPLGSVFDYSIAEMDGIKMHSMQQGNAACLMCNYDPLNGIRENFFERENGIIDDKIFKRRLKIIKKDQDSRTDIYAAGGLVDQYARIQTRSIS